MRPDPDTMALAEPIEKGDRNPYRVVPVPVACLSAWRGGRCSQGEYRRALLTWWNVVVPEHHRTINLDRCTARLLALSLDPVRLLHWLTVSGGYSVYYARRTGRALGFLPPGSPENP